MPATVYMMPSWLFKPLPPAVVTEAESELRVSAACDDLARIVREFGAARTHTMLAAIASNAGDPVPCDGRKAS